MTFVSKFHYPTAIIASLSDNARRFLIRLRNGASRRGQDWMHFSVPFIAACAECEVSDVADLVEELSRRNLVVATTDGTRTRYTLVPQRA